jgi:LytS/YehU family sensor histidine kinase
MRSESGFEYHIETDARLSPDGVSIPVMVLQPFVENAVRHGIPGVTGRTGLINIQFSLGDQELVCRVEDNGIGRQQAQLQKNVGPAAYQSRGMQLTYERIEVINTHSDKKITVEIVDKFNERNEPAGTNVIIRFPIFTVKDATLS